jgi:two-component system, NtrC family, nitrogen regulation sensor histidine kinase GlnL
MMTSSTNAQALLEGMTTTVILLDGGLHILYLNPAAEMLLGHSHRQCVNHPLNQFITGPDSLYEQLNLSFESKHPYTAREQVVVLAPSQEITIDLTVNPLSEPEQPRRLLIEISHVDRQLRLSREELNISQHNATRQLIRGMAHEIKNPLGGLRGAAQLLDRELQSEELKEYTQIIIDEADRLQVLVDRMIGPRTLPNMQRINIHEVLEHVRQLISVEAPGQVRITTAYDPSLPELLADRDMLVQAFLNIIRNALLALADEGGLIKIRTRIKRKFTIGSTTYKLVLEVDIIDTGPGIPKELHETLFFPMITGREGGTGLGLSIAQSLINQHNGLIEFETEPGRTMFSIFLPVTDERTST